MTSSLHLDDSSVEVLKYPDGTNYEYHEPPFVGGASHLRSMDQLTGTYDVVLHAEHWVGDKLNTVRGGTLVVERAAGGWRGGRGWRGLRFDIRFGDGDGDGDGDDPRDLSFTTLDKWSVATSYSPKEGRHVEKGRLEIVPSPGAVSTCGLVRIVARRSPLSLRRPSEGGVGGVVAPSNGEGAAHSASGGRPRGFLGDDDDDERRRRGEEALARYREGCPHWLHSHTPLPTEVVAQILRYLYPPPVWFYEVGDLWIDGMWKNSCPLESWYHDWRYVARRRRSDGPTE